FRPNGPGTTDMLSLQGTCGYLPMYVASFDGVDDYVEVPDSPSLKPNVVSLEAWVYGRNYSNSPYLISKYDPLGSGYQIDFSFDRRISFKIGSANGKRDWSTDTYIAPIDEWYHIVCVYDGRRSFIYKNGILITSYDWGTYAPIDYTAYYATLGVQIARYVYFNGTIANVQIYNTALSQQEIQYLYQEGLGGGPIHLQNLVAWWPLNGDAKDYSGNNNHGTIYGVSFIQNYNPP
ncbi:MAG: LamG domain-containing protein, partial [Candidatus Micrarchaeales archaeon]